MVYFAPGKETFLHDVLDGLQRREKKIPCKYFYDERGSRLFDAICRTEEYYPTRTEVQILHNYAADMARLAGPGAVLVELGSGSGLKTRLLLEYLSRPAAFVPVDISRFRLMESSRELRSRFPRLKILPVCADFTAPFRLPEAAGRRVFYFPGSTIGNFSPEEAGELLGRLLEDAGPGGALLIGVDLKKDKRVLEAAYNDRSGMTAAFNRNVLRRLNDELGTGICTEKFTHRAFYNEAEGRIEMHLVSGAEQTIELAGETIRLRENESICTEHSYKYSLEDFQNLAGTFGASVERTWTDPARLFSVHYLARA
ncbi:MAG TPA: L-histidine N(alpha)-methyltransferase [Verrucomicrobiae bacterium]|nr:L-histidine N(alpha)-methyltransferase [Verrucomicrobiae bacterium]